MRGLALVLFVGACAHRVEDRELQNLNLGSHPSCELHADDLKLSPLTQTSRGLQQGLGITGSLALTTVAYTGDVLIVGGGVLSLALLVGAVDSDAGARVGAELLTKFPWDEYDGFLGPKAYQSTTDWRCPYVDHIGRALRAQAACNLDKGELVAAAAQLNFIETDPVLKRCLSPEERRAFEAQRAALPFGVVPAI